jgi:hypothetical protein
MRAISKPNRSCAIIVEISKVRTGVVSHPVSEKGERGGSPSMVYNGNAIRLNSPVFSKERLRW